MATRGWEVRRLVPSDMSALAAFASRQGWPHRETEWRRLLDLGGEGCFCASRAGHDAIIGTVTSVVYGDAALAWLGMMLVDVNHRRQGVGTALMTACLQHMHKLGVPRVMLDATDAGQPLYEKFGFRALYRVHRWQGQATEFFGRRSRRLKTVDMRAVIAFDELRFGVGRGRVLLHLQAEFPRLCWIDRDKRGRVQGYLFARREGARVIIGPWVHDSPWAATTLLHTAMGAVRGTDITVFLPDCNLAATPIAQDHALRAISHTTRMIWGDAEPPDGWPASIFGVTSLALG